jgi:hypothetical protein
MDVPAVDRRLLLGPQRAEGGDVFIRDRAAARVDISIRLREMWR